MQQQKRRTIIISQALALDTFLFTFYCFERETSQILPVQY